MGPLPSDRLRSLSSPALFRRALPFTLAGVVALFSLWLPTSIRNWWDVAWAGALLLVMLGCVCGVPWRRLPAWTEALPPLGFFVVIALLRDAQGGYLSGFGPLVMLPVFWLALHGSRRQTLAAILGAGLTVGVPLMVPGAPRYPASSGRGALLLVLVVAVVGMAVQQLVATLACRERVAADTAQRLDAVLAAATETSVIGTDQRGRIIVFNQGAERMLGYAAADVLGRVPDFLHDPGELATRAAELDLPAGIEVLTINARRGGAERRHWTYRRKDGTSLPVELTVSAMRDPVGRITGFIGIAEDVSERVRWERQLRESEANLAAVSGVVRRIQSGADARATITAAVCDIAGARTAALLEPDGNRQLVVTAQSGALMPIAAVPMDGEPSGCVTAFLSGRRLFTPDAQADENVSMHLAELLDVRSALFEPVHQQGRVTGVLMALWPEPDVDLSSAAAGAVALLADEAAVALERDDLLRQLRELATSDPLTGLPNRRAWDERLQHEMDVMGRLGQPLSVAVLDLDHFKGYNDRLGHAGGDRLLRAFSIRAHQAIRAADTLARWGGEEFTLLLPGCPVDEARVVVERVRRSLPDGQTCSAGLALWDGRESADQLLRRADDALYRAKSGGRDRVEVSAADRPAPATARAGGAVTDLRARPPFA